MFTTFAAMVGVIWIEVSTRTLPAHRVYGVSESVKAVED
jgi:hypothetical protein